jgi:hypothetical protein
MRGRHTPTGITISVATIVPLVTAGGKILDEQQNSPAHLTARRAASRSDDTGLA